MRLFWNLVVVYIPTSGWFQNCQVTRAGDTCGGAAMSQPSFCTKLAQFYPFLELPMSPIHFTKLFFISKLSYGIYFRFFFCMFLLSPFTGSNPSSRCFHSVDKRCHRQNQTVECPLLKSLEKVRYCALPFNSGPYIIVSSLYRFYCEANKPSDQVPKQ